MRLLLRRSSTWVLGLVVSACVGPPPSPPGDSAETPTGTSRGDETTASPTTAESSASVDADTAETMAGTLDVTPGTSTGDAPGTSSSGTSTGEEPGSSSSAAAPTCDELYGAAPGYLLCLESASECQFLVILAGDSCNALCSSFGGTCLDAFDNAAGTCRILQPSADTCDTHRNDEICVCSK
jgi:hypothetical protein